GLFLNLLMIYLVKTYSRADIGTFKYLLIAFACYDIFLIINHFILDPKSFVLPGIFAIVLHFPYGSPLLTVLSSISFMMSYSILMMHLLYRYWAIKEPSKIVLFSSPMFLFKLFIAIIAANAALVSFGMTTLSPADSEATQRMRAEFRRKLGRDIDTGWVVSDYWAGGKYDVLAITAALGVDAMGVGILILAVVLSSLTYRHIKSAFSLSPHAKSVQIRLLTTVCAQTFVPMVCVTIPFFCDTTLPAFGVTLDFVADTTGLLNSIFPSWDPLTVIVIMKPYRLGLWSIVTCSKRKERPSVSEHRLGSVAPI
ncbi:hypothetical protein PENTCL1PPCAC_4946, partial [Pristionchus entomophagus]